MSVASLFAYYLITEVYKSGMYQEIRIQKLRTSYEWNAEDTYTKFIK